MRSFSTALVVILGISLSAPPVGWAQTTPPWPDGCSVGLPGWAQQGLDSIFNGACDKHDLCWGKCNGAKGPFRGLNYRDQCDQTFLSDLTAACLQRSTQVIFPLGDIDDVEEFLITCQELAVAAFVAVQTVGTQFFWNSQCLRGCNPQACMQAGLTFSTQDNRPPTCGTFPYTGPGFCYRQPYTPDACAFHVCPSFIISEPTEEKEKLQTEDTEDESKTSPDGQPFIGVDCESILDWYCCPCQYCPNNCLM